MVSLRKAWTLCFRDKAYLALQLTRVVLGQPLKTSLKRGNERKVLRREVI